MDRFDLRAERKRRGWSVAYVAVCLDVNPATVDRWESGAVMPGGDNLVRLADLYGVDPRQIAAAIAARRSPGAEPAAPANEVGA